MKIPIIPIGNSKGVRLPKALLKKYQFGDAAELSLVEEGILLRPKVLARAGWDMAFEKANKNKAESLLVPDVFADEMFEEWK